MENITPLIRASLAAFAAVLFSIALPSAAVADVKHGSQLEKGKNCGLPEGTKLEPSSQTTFSEPCVVEGKLLGSVSTTHAEGVVRFVKCKFVNPGYVSMSEGADKGTPGTSLYAVARKGKGSVELVDCEVYGGKSVAVLHVDKMVRTYVAEGNDLIRAPAGDSFYTEVFGTKLIKASPDSHSDVLQATFGPAPADKPMVAMIHLLRCRFDGRNLVDSNGMPLEGTNAAIQFGSFKENSGAGGTITDCHFDGGGITLNISVPRPPSTKLVLRGNTFGRHCKSTALRGGMWETHDVDDSNVWEGTKDPARGKPGK